MTQVNLMPIVIKKADELVYSRFKAKAFEKGLRIGEAITEAMDYWLELKNKEDFNQIMENRNEIAFRRIFPNLLNQNEGNWGLISNGDLVDVYKTKFECFDAIKEKNLIQTHNLVFPIEKIASRHLRFGPYRRVSRETEI